MTTCPTLLKGLINARGELLKMGPVPKGTKAILSQDVYEEISRWWFTQQLENWKVWRDLAFWAGKEISPFEPVPITMLVGFDLQMDDQQKEDFKIDLP